MSDACCEAKNPELQKIAESQKKILWIVLGLNLTMFFVELIGGILAKSAALSSDSLDMLGDAVSYGVTLYVINRSFAAKANAAKLKGWIIMLSAVTVMTLATYRFLFQEVPDSHVMSILGIFALVVNITCLALLTKHKKSDVNMESIWICSRNDIVANTSVIVAAGLVKWSGTAWPDLIVGLALGIFFTKSALHIFALSQHSSSRESLGKT